MVDVWKGISCHSVLGLGMLATAMPRSALLAMVCDWHDCHGVMAMLGWALLAMVCLVDGIAGHGLPGLAWVCLNEHVYHGATEFGMACRSDAWTGMCSTAVLGLHYWPW